MTSGYEIGEFEEDGALDERDTLIDWLEQRIERRLCLEGFCGVDISAVRADIAMLATIIGTHGGGHLVQHAKIEEWAGWIDKPFTDDSMWGLTPWPAEVKAEWRAGCRRTIQQLLDVLEE